MIRHEYKGFGGPPLPPDLQRYGSRGEDSCGSARHSQEGQQQLPLVRAPGVFGDSSSPIQQTNYPYVTGAAVIAFKYKDGVMMAADTLGSYGKTKRYKSVQRMHGVAPTTLLGAGGEMSDYKYILTILDELLTDDFTADDGHVIGPREIHNYLTRVLYNRRNKFDPLWNTLVVAGVEKKSLPGGEQAAEPFLGWVSMIGVQFEDDHVATGYGNYLVRPILRLEQRGDMEEGDAIRLMEKCLRVLCARDSSFLNKVQISKVTASGVTISQPYAIAANWELTFFERPLKDPFSGSW